MTTADKKNKPLVSIVMPVKNTGKFIERAIASIQKQTFQNWELIAVDNYSSDTSWEILRKLARHDGRIKIHRRKNLKGVSGAANYAISKAI